MLAAASETFDVFLSHNSADKPAVEELAHKLLQLGISPWLDKWNLIPGQPWQSAIEEALARCASCVVFIGPSGVGPWQNEEMRAAVDRRVNNAKVPFPVIPVLLPGAKREERSRLPSFLVATTWVEFPQTIDDEDSFHRLVCGIRGLEPGPRPAEQTYSGECPYRGLLFFNVEHAPFFFGREALTEWLLHELRPLAESDDKTRFLGIVGPSGSGKSSLARAGLVAALKRGALRGSAEWPVAICRPGSDPLENLAIALTDIAGAAQGPSAVRELVSELRDSERSLHLFTRTLLRQGAHERRLVVLIDQFEEVFTLCRDQKTSSALIANLMHASTVVGGQTIVLLTLRADFYGECSGYPSLAAALSEHQVLVGQMEVDQLRRSIERPAQLVGCEFEPGLVDLLIEDVENQPGSLPLLEHTLSELWDRKHGRRLTHAAYHSIGGLAGALERRADEIYEELSDSEKQICRRIFMRLVQPSEGGKLAKHRAELSELMPAEGDNSEFVAVIGKLAGPQARLITIETSGSAATDDAFPATAARNSGRRHEGLREPAEFIDVAHEALIRVWGRLRRWLDEDQEFQLWRKRLSASIEVWERTNRDPESLMRRLLLAEAIRWSQARGQDLNREELDFIGASESYDRLKLEEQEQQQREFHEEQQQRLRAETRRADAEQRAARRAKMAAVSLAGLLLAVIAGSVISWYMSKRSRAMDLADQARRRNSVELALQAVRESRVRQAVEALYITARQEVAALETASGVNDVVFGPGRTWVATAHVDGNVQLWKSPGSAPLLWHAFNIDTKYPHPAEVLSLAFHPKEDLLATVTAAGDALVRLWRIGSKQEEWKSSPQGEDLNAVDFNRTGNLIAAAARSGKLTVWNRETNSTSSISPPHQATSLAFSPIDDRIVAGFADGTIISWNVGANSYDNVPGDDQRGKVHAVSFSPNGENVAIASQHGAWVWRTGSRDVPTRAQSPGEPRVTVAVAFSPRADLIAAADAEGDVSILNASSLREESRIAVTGIGNLTAVAFQPDPGNTGSAKLAVAGFKGSVRLYELNVDLLLKSLEAQ